MNISAIPQRGSASHKNYHMSDSTEQDNYQVIHEKVQELYTKIKNGDTVTSYQIGGQSFTEKEWKKLLTRFDELEEMIREEQKERFHRESEDAKKKKALSGTEAVSKEKKQDDLIEDISDAVIEKLLAERT